MICLLLLLNARGLDVLDTAGWAQIEGSDLDLHVESATARLLMISRRNLLFLPDAVQSAMSELVQEADDPIRLPPHTVQHARAKHYQWLSMKACVPEITPRARPVGLPHRLIIIIVIIIIIISLSIKLIS